ncbi:hypothetical protein FISHEDRAFT_60309 [Fistulina hepatica ATCC 64428]|uniref:ferric-chelate reductase (NADPH) n=1 Tax=Fistulina hepatica ATCC 64428 TaxID=1128425 RepID=A0A0D7A6W1_9AGAR|nr:hypothetical protein FISHEDRAFT_60309 [Fistulina hepatica ATCC 64428]
MMNTTGGTWWHGKYIPTSAQITAYQMNHEPWAKSVRFGYYGLYFLAVTVFIAILMNVHFQFTARCSLKRAAGGKCAFQDKVYAVFRYLTYPRLPTSVSRFITSWYKAPSLGPTLLLAAGFVFTTLYCFADTYYYRPPFYGSSPLGLRSEWLAMAMLPFLIVFGQKISIIGILTGASHDKLQVFHQGVAGLHFYMSIVHTISMSIRADREKGMANAWATNSAYRTGFGALVPLIWLCCASLPVFRKAAYEFFWWMHLAAIGSYFAVLWYHVYEELDGPYYMYATFAVFAFGTLLRVGWMMYINLRNGVHHARLQILPTGAVEITIPTRLNWAPGQHVFLRFLAVRPFDSHPFSIANFPAQDPAERTMRFVIRPQQGFTRALMKCASEHGNSERDFVVFLDGPFGESARDLRSFDEVLLLAGGSGMAYIAPIFLDLARSMKSEETKSRVTKVSLVWTSRFAEEYVVDSFKWFESDINEAQALVSKKQASVDYFVSDENNESVKPDDDDDKKSVFSLHFGRPDIRAIIREKSMEWEGRVAVVSCGPDTFSTDASNEVADVQIDILMGTAKCNEMFLLSDTFGW